MEKLTEKLRSWLGEENKLLKKNRLLILLLTGILLLVIGIPVPDSNEKQKKTKTDDGVRENTEEQSLNTYAGYEAYLEKRVAEALEYVEGVGKAEVMITLRSSGEKVVEKDQSADSQTTEEADSGGGTRTQNSRSSDKTSVYQQDADGSQTPYVSKELTPEIAGVVVIAQGGDNAVTVQNITEAIQALFGIDAHKIKIMKRTAT